MFILIATCNCLVEVNLKDYNVVTVGGSIDLSQAESIKVLKVVVVLIIFALSRQLKQICNLFFSSSKHNLKGKFVFMNCICFLV